MLRPLEGVFAGNAARYVRQDFFVYPLRESQQDTAQKGSHAVQGRNARSRHIRGSTPAAHPNDNPRRPHRQRRRSERDRHRPADRWLQHVGRVRARREGASARRLLRDAWRRLAPSLPVSPRVAHRHEPPRPRHRLCERWRRNASAANDARRRPPLHLEGVACPMA